MKHSLANTDYHDALWKCPDCNCEKGFGTEIWLHPDEDHTSNDWTRSFIAEHQYVHEENLANMYSGNRNSMRLALKYPHVHTAIIRVLGPIEGLTDEHQVQIYESARIPNHGIVLPPAPEPEPEPEPDPEPVFPLGLDYNPDEVPEY